MTTLSRTLELVYGPATAARLEEQIHSLASRVRLPAPSPQKQSPLSERDALMIVYPDQVRDPLEPPLRTLTKFAKTHLRGLISGVHLLPFYPWSSDDGFSVKDFFAVDPAYGGWENISELGAEFDLMFDAVFNHMSAQGEWFKKFLADDPLFRDFFVTASDERSLERVIRPRALPLLTPFPSATGMRKVWTTFSHDQVDLNFKNPEVLLAVLEALLFYVQKGAKFIRLDAIAFLWKEPGTTCLHLPQTHAIIQIFRAVLDQLAPDVRLITETNVPHRDNISYFGDGMNEAQLVYNFALAPLVLHSFQKANAERLTDWAQTLSTPSATTTFFNFLASHDGIGVNPVRGILSEAEIEDMVAGTVRAGGMVSYKSVAQGPDVPYELNINFLDALAPALAGEDSCRAAAKFITAQAIMLSLQGVPGIYFHSLFGSRGDLAGARTSGIKRRVNREKLGRSQLETELADKTTLRSQVFSQYADLLRYRRHHRAFAPNAPQRVLPLDPRIFALQRESLDQTERVLCLHNLSGDTVHLRMGSTGEVSLPPFAWKWVPQPRDNPAV